MEIHAIDAREIVVPERQRRETSSDALIELSDSIARNGLIHPIVVRREYPNKILLVAGERRLKAMQILWARGFEVRCGTQAFPDGSAPCNWLGELDPVDALEVEIEENVRREDFDWRDRSRAMAKLVDLRTEQAKLAGRPPPSMGEVIATCIGDENELRSRILVAKHLDNPVIKDAASASEALKILKRQEELSESAALGRSLGPVLKDLHTLINGDCLKEMLKIPDGAFDVVLTDPPYGMNAQDFGDGAGKTHGAHTYDDTLESWAEMMTEVAIHTWRICRPSAHCYVFCDLDQFHALHAHFNLAGWIVHRTPLIWVNPTANRVPWPLCGPMRKWQMILYAIKGKKPVTKIYPDVITVPSDTNLNHQAQKPVALYQNLLARSCNAGDKVIDPFCGTGPIFPAAHELKLIATGIELDPAAYGIAAKRLQELR